MTMPKVQLRCDTDGEAWAACVVLLIGPLTAGANQARRRNDARQLALAALRKCGEEYTDLVEEMESRLDC